MRAVLDTNVLARPVHNAAGPAGEVFARLSRSPHVVIVSSFMLAELQRILRYPRLRRLHGLSDEAIDEYTITIETAAVVIDVPPNQIASVVSEDRDDDQVIATAVAGRADVLCTHDRHLHGQAVRDYCARFGIRVCTDVELVKELRASSSSAEP